MNSSRGHITPYTSIEEHLKDCLSWLDECLDFCSNQENRLPLSPVYSGRQLLARQEASPSHLLPLASLACRLSLSGFESFMVLLALAPELDMKYEYIYSTLQGNPACLHPSLGLAKNLYSFLRPVHLSMLERITDYHSPLNQYCFDRTAADDQGDTTLHRNLVLKRLTVRYLLGYTSITEMESTATDLLPSRPVSHFICYPGQYQLICQLLKNRIEDSNDPHHDCLLVHLSGEKGTGRKYLLSQILDDSSLQVRTADMRSLYHMEPDKFQLALENLALDAFLWGRCLYLDDISPEHEEETYRLRRSIAYLSKNSRALFLSHQSDKLPDVTTSTIIHVPFPIPNAEVRGRLWRNLGSSYPFEDNSVLEAFGHQYRLTPGRTAGILAQAVQTAAGQGLNPIPLSTLAAAISQNQSLSFQSLAARTTPFYTWDDLQLATPSQKLLRSAFSRIKMKYRVEDQWGFGRKSSYGKGLSILFYGPPGTGKTMAAQVIAHESGLKLYRVDLSQIFNKYIGETEKNIGRIFDEAKKADIILFFDEADSLFSKRTEVSNSNDRHSNAEISYLLQKMEEYDGVTILSTNLYQNFDPAFLRRITYTVHFDMPDAGIRLCLWQSMVPDAAPVSSKVDFQHLARQFELSGSSIKSILRGAAYLAAEEDTEIDTRHVIQAMKYEFIKAGKIISSEEFGEYSIYL